VDYGAEKEWKRYKRYSREDILSAIEAVRRGMSAVQAARKHRVPSRTLYDKVKKLGITTSRPFRRSTVTNGSSGARFPYGIGGNVNGGIYSGTLSKNETESASSSLENVPGKSIVKPEVVYAKPKDVPPNLISESMVRCIIDNPNSLIHCKQKQQQQQEDIDDQVEDLSVSRKSDAPAMISPSTSLNAIKVEIQDVGPDNNDYCDYN